MDKFGARAGLRDANDADPSSTRTITHSQGPKLGRRLMVYSTVVADPPWSPKLGSTWATATTDKARPQKHYATATLDEIISHQPPTQPKSHLWLWVLPQHIDWGYTVARAWGFEPQQTITWAKPGLGVGRFQCNTEHVLVCRKGNRAGNPFGASRGTWFEWPRGRHSAKPDAFYDLVERCSPGPYLEMYSRTPREGWDAWGNEASNPIDLRSAS